MISPLELHLHSCCLTKCKQFFFPWKATNGSGHTINEYSAYVLQYSTCLYHQNKNTDTTSFLYSIDLPLTAKQLAAAYSKKVQPFIWTWEQITIYPLINRAPTPQMNDRTSGPNIDPRRKDIFFRSNRTKNQRAWSWTKSFGFQVFNYAQQLRPIQSRIPKSPKN